MLVRREMIGWLAAVLAGARSASAAPAIGQAFEGQPFDKPGPGLVPVLRRGGFVRLGAPLSQLGRGVFSIANANDRYVAVTQLSAIPKQGPFLVVPGGAVSAESWGSGFGGKVPGSATFHVDLALADALAKAWAVPRRDRTPLGAGLVGRFRVASPPLAAGSPMPITLEVQNGGAAPVGFSVGGRQRGPRDNRFAFAVTHNGSPLPVITAHDFGGIMGYREIKPGASIEVTADLASWVKITAPGRYRVDCRYEAELVPGTRSPEWPDHGHETWDLTLTEAIDVVVV